MKFCVGFVALFLGTVAAARTTSGPDCSGPERYPALEVYVGLKNAGMVIPDAIDFKHAQSRTIASQRVGKALWRQVFHVTWPLKSGKKFEAIVVEDVSNDECSISNPQIYLISKRL